MAEIEVTPSCNANSDSRALTLVRSPAQTHTFITQWAALCGASSRPDPFLSPEWLGPFFQIKPRRLELLAGFHNDKLVLLIPVARHPHEKNFRVSMCLGGYVSSEQQQMGLVSPEIHMETAVSALMDFFARRKIKPAIALDVLFDQDPLALSLVHALESNGWRKLTQPGKQSPYVQLDSDFDGYLQGIKRRVRREYLRRKRKMETHVETGQRIISSPEALRRWLPDMIQIEQASWKKHTGIFSSAHRDLTVRQLFDLAARDRLRGFLLFSQGQLVAYDLELFHDNRLWSYTVAYDAAYRSYGPGIHLQVEVIKYGFQQKAASVELLGDMQPYKLNWAHGTRQRSTVYLFPPGILAAVGPGLLKTAKKLRQWIDK